MILEKDIGENKIICKQNVSGFWYCTEIQINCISIIDGIALMSRAIDDINKMLREKNEIEKKKQ